jgi:hypothetical protein
MRSEDGYYKECANPNCAKLFSPDYARRKYCTDQCAKRAEWSRRSKRTRPTQRQKDKSGDKEDSLPESSFLDFFLGIKKNNPHNH